MSRPLCDNQQGVITHEMETNGGPREFWCVPAPMTFVPSADFLVGMHYCARLVKQFCAGTWLTPVAWGTGGQLANKKCPTDLTGFL